MSQTNDQIILENVLAQAKQNRAPNLTSSEYFGIYVAEQVLKDFDLSDEEVSSGIVDGGGDGGIDAIYTFVNGELAQEDSDFASLKKDVALEFFVLQSKGTNGFAEITIQKLQSTSTDVFDLSKKLVDLKSLYNEDLLKAVEVARNTYRSLAATFPKIKFTYIYATLGDGTVHPNVRQRAENLKTSVKSQFGSAEIEFQFLASPQLLQLGQKRPKTTFSMRFTEAIFTDKGVVALVELESFNSFLTNESGLLRKHLFESNVRDYQGANSVNEEIQSGLKLASKEDFWWLNNGVTIIASKHIQSGKELTIEEPQIVNGLQTSTEVAKYFKSKPAGHEARKILVRIVTPDGAESSDKIIKATNSQTPIPEASLRATEKVHRDIEEYLKPFSIFYDRRKNSHRNEGKPISAIISIPTMAQAIMSMLLQRPNDARARPSSLLRKNEDYNSIFSSNYPIQVYHVAAFLHQLVKKELKADSTFQARDKNNLLFYVIMCLSSLLSNSSIPTASQLASIDLESVDSTHLSKAILIARNLYQKLGSSDQVAKGKDFVDQMKLELQSAFELKI
jgi:AIPR protein